MLAIFENVVGNIQRKICNNTKKEDLSDTEKFDDNKNKSGDRKRCCCRGASYYNFYLILSQIGFFTGQVLYTQFSTQVFCTYFQSCAQCARGTEGEMINIFLAQIGLPTYSFQSLLLIFPLGMLAEFSDTLFTLVAHLNFK